MSTKAYGRRQDINMRDAPLAFIDLETTGLNPLRHEIIEIGLVLAEQKRRAGAYKLAVIDEWEIKVLPSRIEDAEPEALRINGYKKEDWLFAVELAGALKELSRRTKNAVIIAQNIAFDWSFLEKAYRDTGVPMSLHPNRKLDTISLWFGKYHMLPDPEKFGLYHLAKYLGIQNEKAHTALSDARTLFEIYKKVMTTFGS